MYESRVATNVWRGGYCQATYKWQAALGWLRSLCAWKTTKTNYFQWITQTRPLAFRSWRGLKGTVRGGLSAQWSSSIFGVDSTERAVPNILRIALRQIGKQKKLLHSRNQSTNKNRQQSINPTTRSFFPNCSTWKVFSNHIHLITWSSLSSVFSNESTWFLSKANKYM